MHNFCGSCGEANGLDHKFCARCGEKLTSTVSGKDVFNISGNTETFSTSASEKKKWGIFVLVGFGVILVILAISSAFSDDSNSNSAQTNYITPTDSAQTNYITPTDQAYLDGSGSNYFLPYALSALNADGISAGSDPNFKSMTDSIYAGIQAKSTAQGPITESAIEVSLMPGNGIYTLVQNLFLDEGAKLAFEDELKTDAANDEALSRDHSYYSGG